MVGRGTDRRLAFPFEVMWEITERCNRRCALCYKDCTGSGVHEPPLDEVERVLAELEDGGCMLVFYDGGDPFLRPDIVDVLKLTTPRFCCYIMTPGDNVSQPLASAVAQLGVAIVFVLIESPIPDVHDEFVGEVGNFERAVDGITSLVAAGVPVALTMRVTRRNQDDFEALFGLADDIGVSQVSLMQLYPVGRARSRFLELKPDYTRLRDAVETLGNTAFGNGARPLTHPFFPDIHNCCSQFCTIDARGSIFPCSYLRHLPHFGAVEEGVASVWNAEPYDSHRRRQVGGECLTCFRYNDCGGGCRAMALALTGDIAQPDPTCWHLQDIKNGHALV
jgi:radical SAM protein with 4Fe4S-binding SPASM domain